MRASPWLVAGPSGGWANSLACPKVGSRVPDPNFTRKKDRLLLSFPSGRRIPGVGPSRYEKQCGAGPVHYSQDEKRLGVRSGPVYHPPEEEWRQLPPQVQPAEHGLVISRPTGRRLARSQRRRWSTLPPAILKPPRMTWVVQHSNAQPVCFADAIDTPETATRSRCARGPHQPRPAGDAGHRGRCPVGRVPDPGWCRCSRMPSGRHHTFSATLSQSSATRVFASGGKRVFLATRYGSTPVPSHSPPTDLTTLVSGVCLNWPSNG